MVNLNKGCKQLQNMTQTPKTIKDIADLAKVSTATISRALNPDTKMMVAPRTRAKIEDLARKNGYTPNWAARNLRQKNSHTIGIVLPYLPGIFYSNYYNHILAAVSDKLIHSPYQFKLLLLDQNKSKWDQYDFKNGERVDGLLVIHWFKYFTSKKVLQNLNLPCVIINDIEPNGERQFVGVDHVVSGQIAANYLLRCGHRRIGVLSGPEWSVDNQQRLEGFFSVLKKHNLTVAPEHMVRADYLEEKAYAAADQFLRAKLKITALFACNDQMAFGAIRRFKELGITCPQDISVIGYDDEFQAARFDPPLTTIHVPVYDIAAEAVSLLLQHLANPKSAPLTGIKYLPSRLVERQSCRSMT
ncbi:MAG: LacI family DNA-binding transcriptional regulator [Candidatus Omnitrophica bacterium]|nr:LacI family DNA-binding transcriptional regulator [Candidatus Omnitrophota bacterium]